ncbi:Transcriptional regulator NovG [Streptomyces sp. RB5]|uniref:Transcriptional regulator NovG n=1 Tax=Streptomyces smaragdinus TaxID=2585196 RepID=A0A7K0CC22_9ACTN|nr:ParB/RepB/Spo0J family partition protein [Streptomyces smaragdinus]MQY10989.1 Transcriptional regulator NovG [Streptomyces smaragdinus]
MATAAEVANHGAARPGERVEISRLEPGYSPRLGGLDGAYVEQISALGDLPPIVVQRATMRVVDGAHRLAAARFRGERSIAVTFFEGTDDEAFVAAVRLNIRHGLPLTAHERTAAARRILQAHPDWSDRWLASVCGVSATTVGALRKRSAGHFEQLNTRVGRDGRRHPLSVAEGRQKAAEIMRGNPRASLREVARQSGISVGTALDVRRKLAAADDAGSGQEYEPATAAADVAAPATRATLRVTADPQQRLALLLRDPAVQYSDRGRMLLRLLSTTFAFGRQADDIAAAMPDHSRGELRDVATACAHILLEFAERVAPR